MIERYDTTDARPIAFFDFDGTLTTRDSLMPFLKHVVGTRQYYAKLALVSPVLGAYVLKLIKNDVAKRVVLTSYLAGYHIDELFELGQSFYKGMIPTMLRPEGMERLRWHQRQGHCCVLVSASMDVYLNAWAESEHFCDVICTSLEKNVHGYVSGNISGRNCHGKEKLRRIRRWQGGRELTETYAYGDTVGDMHMMSAATHGFLWQSTLNKFVPV